MTKYCWPINGPGVLQVGSLLPGGQQLPARIVHIVEAEQVQKKVLVSGRLYRDRWRPAS